MVAKNRHEFESAAEINELVEHALRVNSSVNVITEGNDDIIRTWTDRFN